MPVPTDHRRTCGQYIQHRLFHRLHDRFIQRIHLSPLHELKPREVIGCPGLLEGSQHAVQHPDVGRSSRERQEQIAREVTARRSRTSQPERHPPGQSLALSWQQRSIRRDNCDARPGAGRREPVCLLHRVVIAEDLAQVAPSNNEFVPAAEVRLHERADRVLTRPNLHAPGRGSPCRL